MNGLFHKLSVIIRNLYVVGAPVLPSEADAPLVVNPNTILTFAVTRKLFEATAWQCRQVF